MLATILFIVSFLPVSSQKNINIELYKTTTLPVVLHVSETRSLTLREEHRLRVFENKALRRIFARKREEGWREASQLVRFIKYY
jgi:hypothetical protein